ncbi:SET domain-containing protein [Dendrothele bispora CBS 962.96]|uniref:SET domain-containing protein n=1 Tax=Dendrothele bispora (strain CBS 962.96) TaxID=1314807 RepID=A0A4S8LGL8_DENBC|nr:SET domain-containing protein [Dendrothele bispora CBS 962.96]
MKRGFLNKHNAFGKASTQPNSVIKHEGPLFDLSALSKEVGGLQKVMDAFASPKVIETKSLDHPEDAWILTALPSQAKDATLADVPDGWAECFITGRAKRAITSVPGFPEALPLPDPARPKPYEIVKSPGKGTGMFATRNIEWGELIIAERPMLVIPAISQVEAMAAKGFAKNYTLAQLRQAQMKEMESTMEILFNRMEREYQEAYKKLWNCHENDGSGPLFGIARTNGFVIDDYNEPNNPGDRPSYSGIFKDCSRINHSCRPNADRAWDSPTFSLQFRACKPIKKGEEITITYIEGLTEPTSNRQNQLTSYAFTCTCEACSNPEISDPRSKEIKELLVLTAFTFNPMKMAWMNPRTGKELNLGEPAGKGKGKGKKDMIDLDVAATESGHNMIEPALKGLKLMEEEGLHGSSEYEYLLKKVSQGYLSVLEMGFKEKDQELEKWVKKYETYQKYFKSARNAESRREENEKNKSTRNGVDA